MFYTNFYFNKVEWRTKLIKENGNIVGNARERNMVAEQEGNEQPMAMAEPGKGKTKRRIQRNVLNPINCSVETMQKIVPPKDVNIWYTLNYKGCAHPVCIEAMNNESKRACNFNIQVQGTSANEVSLYWTGKHCDDFYPNPEMLRRDKKISNELKNEVAMNDFSVGPKQIQTRFRQKGKDSENIANNISLNNISQAKYNEKRKLHGNPQLQWENVMRQFAELAGKKPHLAIRENMAGRHFSKFKPDEPFIFQVFNTSAIAKCAKGLAECVNFDCVWSMAKINSDQMAGKEIDLSVSKEELPSPHNFPVYCITAVDNNYKPHIISLAVASKENEILIKEFFLGLKEKLQSTHPNWCPVVVIDDGQANCAAMKKLKRLGMIENYFLCKFHVLRAWWKRLHFYRALKNETKAMIMGNLKLLMLQKTEESFWKLYRIIRELYTPFFDDYFDKFWLAQKDNWTCINRKNCYSCYNTNNVIERIFREVREFMDHKKSKRIDELFSKLVHWFDFEEYNDQFELITPSLLLGANKRFQNAKDIPSQHIAKAVKEDHGCESVDHVYFVQSQNNPEVKYRICLQFMSCNCPDYITTGRCCKHLYAAQMEYIKEHKLEVLKDVPFHYSQLVHIHI